MQIDRQLFGDKSRLIPLRLVASNAVPSTPIFIRRPATSIFIRFRVSVLPAVACCYMDSLHLALAHRYVNEQTTGLLLGTFSDAMHIVSCTFGDDARTCVCLDSSCR